MRGSIILLFLLFVVLSCNCKKDRIKHYEDVFFQFNMPFRVDPGVEAIHVGDTLTISATISDSLMDLFSNKRYYLPDFLIPVLWGIKEPGDTSKNISFQPKANDKFEFFFETGYGNVSSNEFANLFPQYKGGKYLYKCKIIPKKDGVFSLWLQDKIIDRYLPQSFAPEPPGWQRVPMVRFNRYIINEGETHFNLYKERVKVLTLNGGYGTGILLEKDFTYTFVVLP